ncbi:MAG: hypothetical protein BWX88_05326 [Planctomycetes bacterium ADurb.Bin126]|nr:MAG: hypothetical protein BWX88_05326 [Planctomycetes bacterium ADurb.Bin126]
MNPPKPTPAQIRAIDRSYEKLRAAGKAYRAAAPDETSPATRLARRLYKAELARHEALLHSSGVYGASRLKGR